MSEPPDARAGAPQAVVFDLDGVLLDSEQVWNGARQELTQANGGTWTAQAGLAMLGMSSREWSRYMHDHLGVALSPAEISDAVVALVCARYRVRLPLIAGADHAVRAIGALWPLGLASSANRQIIELVLQRSGWQTLFAITVSSEEVRHGKPAPDVYLEATRRLGASAVDCVAVEDSAAGIRSAHAARLAVVAIPNRVFPPDAEALEQADLVLDTIAELAPASLAGLTGPGR